MKIWSYRPKIGEWDAGILLQNSKKERNYVKRIARYLFGSSRKPLVKVMQADGTEADLAWDKKKNEIE